MHDDNLEESHAAMEQRVINPSKALRTLRKTSTILKTMLAGYAGEQARQISPPGTWSVRDIVRHLAEYEPILHERIALMLAEDMPALPSIDNQHITDTPDNDPDIQAIVSSLQARRQDLLTFLDSVTADQWQRQGRHPQQGLATVLDVVLNGALHDIDHIGQIMETLNR